MPLTVYMFEAHSIQPYVLQGGKLRDMVCASELIESLVYSDPTGSTDNQRELDLVLAQLNLEPEINCWFSRRGGAAFYLFLTGKDAFEQAQRLRDLWYMTVTAIAPDLPFCHTIAQADKPADAIMLGSKKLRLARNRLPVNPVSVSPVVRRVPRTGLAASVYSVREKELIDSPTIIKRCDRYVDASLLNSKFTPKGYDLKFPANMDSSELDSDERNLNTLFPFMNDSRRIAVLHADGNGLGQILRDLSLSVDLENVVSYARIYMEMSRAIADATQKAALHAMECVVIPAATIDQRSNLKDSAAVFDQKEAIPIRPLIMGGDDLTVIIRADIALDFAATFVEEFERQTRLEFKAIKNILKDLDESVDVEKLLLPEKLTACAGLAFIKANQPFAMGYTLASSICSHVKNRARAKQKESVITAIPSAMGFHRVTSTLIEDYNSAVQRESTVSHAEKSYRLTLGAYGLGEHAHELPKFEYLRTLISAFNNPDVPRGAARHLYTLMHVSLNDASRAYDRWKTNLKKRDSKLFGVYMHCHSSFGSYFSAKVNVEDVPTHLRKDALPFFAVEKMPASEVDAVSYLADLNHALSVDSRMITEAQNNE